jgi:DNA transposition AAA+ family ATPase
MPFTHPYHRFADKVAEFIVSCDVRLIVVDDAEQLNENGFAVLHDLVAQTGRPVVLIGDEHLLQMHVHVSAFAPLALLRRLWLFWSRKEKRDV